MVGTADLRGGSGSYGPLAMARGVDVQRAGISWGAATRDATGSVPSACPKEMFVRLVARGGFARSRSRPLDPHHPRRSASQPPDLSRRLGDSAERFPRLTGARSEAAKFSGESRRPSLESSHSNRACKSPLNTARCEATNLGPSGWRPRFESGFPMPRSSSCRRAAGGSRSSPTEHLYSRNRRSGGMPGRARSLACSSSDSVPADLNAMPNDRSPRT